MKNFRKIFTTAIFFSIICAQIFGETRVSAERQKLIDYGLTLQGTPYVWGGKTPSTGLDCSGFVGYVAKQALEKNISGTAAMMYKSLEHISPEEREPGDLIFFAVKSGSTYNITHVGIYLGLYHGEGKLDGERIFLHSASDGKYTGVIVRSINDSYWEKHFYGYARFLPPTPIPEPNQEIQMKEDSPKSTVPVADKVSDAPSNIPGETTENVGTSAANLPTPGKLLSTEDLVTHNTDDM